MKDLVYYFDKLSPYQGHAFGEIQANFNMSFTTDGTKDSTKLQVWSFEENEVEPYTILYHYNTNTWWCVINDKVERYANESGFWYLHTIQCNGARELLNARDLTDCGFNAKRYTIAQFLNRLIKLSKWDFQDVDHNVLFNYGNNINQYEKVAFVKTFENYTLYSALRELLDGYNCDFKLTFSYSGDIDNLFYLHNANIIIIPKTGNIDLPIVNQSIFQDVREIKKIDKNNFGTTVVSNAENVISSVAKIFPSQGSARLSATAYNITNTTAVLRLPSNVYKANWLKIFFKLVLVIYRDAYGDQSEEVIHAYDVMVSNKKQIEDLTTLIYNSIKSAYGQSIADDFISKYNNNISTIHDKIKKAGTITLYEGNSLNPVDGTIVKGQNVPYIPQLRQGVRNYELVLTDKAQRDCLPEKKSGIYWERGSNLIQGFDLFEDNTCAITSYENTDYQSNNLYIFQDNVNHISLRLVQLSMPLFLGDLSFAVNYIPMSDLKIEIDNQRSTKDMQLYNQNGRLTDSVALSKILNSYSREISSNKITKYMDYYDFNDIPKAGQMVNVNNELYVINNVSIDFYLNENNGYYMPCEFNLCKYVSTKSLMVNPNTNIRDYAIPQNYNVKRKQIYRDYLEFDYTQDNNADGVFYCNTVPLDLGIYGYTPVSHTVAIECNYEEQVNGSRFWDYQLETTIYRLDKMHIEVLDFKDNNIIGYGSQNVHSAFVVSRIFDNLLDTINTPISYVDDKGEVKGFTLCWATAEQIATAWEDYKISEGYGGRNDYDLTNFSVFIPSFIVGSLTSCDMVIDETDYEKDATEVPVFEYVFQVGDSENVVVGDHILDNIKDDSETDLLPIYFYGFVKKEAGTLNQINALKYANDLVISAGVSATLHNAVEITDNPNNIAISLWSLISNSGGNTMVPAGYVAPESGYDYAIYRIKYSRYLTAELGEKELVMVLKNVPSNNISYGQITIYKNKYKLK